MKFVTGIFVLASLLFGTEACNVGCDNVVEGICIVDNGFDYDVSKISQTLEIVREEYQPIHSFDSLSDVFRSTGLTVVFVEDLVSPIDDKRNGEYYSNENIIYVQYHYDTKSKFAKCSNPYKILAHEVLHFFDKYLLGYAGDHDTPYVWGLWALNNNVSGDQIVENKIAVRVAETCMEYFHQYED